MLHYQYNYLSIIAILHIYIRINLSLICNHIIHNIPFFDDSHIINSFALFGIDSNTSCSRLLHDPNLFIINHPHLSVVTVFFKLTSLSKYFYILDQIKIATKSLDLELLAPKTPLKRPQLQMHTQGTFILIVYIQYILKPSIR